MQPSGSKVLQQSTVVDLSEWLNLPGLPENWSNVAGIVKPGLVADIVGDWGVQDDILSLFWHV